MRNAIVSAALALTMLPATAVAQEQKKAVQEQKKPAEPLVLKVGDVAPDFTLLHYDGQGVKPLSLKDFRGKKNVVVAFFVFAFTGG